MISSIQGNRQSLNKNKSAATALSPDKVELNDLLIAVADERDKHAFAKLFRWFAPKVLRFGNKQFSNPTLANELLQETMTSVWRKSHLYDCAKGAATTWVFTVMRNASFDMLRKMQSNKEDNLSEDIWPLMEAEHVEVQTFTDHLNARQLKAYLKNLPDAQRQVVHGVYFEELTQEQLAKQLDIPLGTVKSRLRLALLKLREYMGADNG